MIQDLIDLSDWKTKSQILKELNQQDVHWNERTFREKVKKQNQSWYNGLVKVYIAHCVKGYKATTCEKEILRSVADNRKRALDMLYEEAKVKKQLGRNYNLKMIINDDGMFYVEE